MLWRLNGIKYVVGLGNPKGLKIGQDGWEVLGSEIKCAYETLTYLDAMLADSDSGSTFQIGLVLHECKTDPNPSG